MAKSNFSLTADEKNEVQNYKKKVQKTKKEGMDKRARAILLLGDEKKTRAESTEMCEVCLKTIYNWQNRYKDYGIKGIQPLPKGGKERRLNAEQLEILTEIIIAGPEHAGYETGIWITPLVVNLIKRKFSIDYSTSQVRRILHRLKFEVLPAIHREVVEKDGVLFYEDEAVFQQSDTISRTWAKKGIGTEVKSKPRRESVKVYGAVNVTEEKKPLWHFHFAEKLNFKSFIKFLSIVLRRYEDRKVFVILDNVRYHHACAVREWLDARKDRVKLFFLPPYSPKLNAT